jgi:hypothetical protein
MKQDVDGRDYTGCNPQTLGHEKDVRIAELESALRDVVRHWNDFGDVIVFNNAANRDDYGFGEVVEAAKAHLQNETESR